MRTLKQARTFQVLFLFSLLMFLLPGMIWLLGTAKQAQASPVALVYNDNLASTWQTWSWDSEATEVSSPVFGGETAISFTPQAKWGGISFYTRKSVSGNDYQTLQFSLYTTQPNQKFSIVLFDAYARLLSYPVPLQKYGLPNGGVWKTYVIPLSDLGAENAQITGFVFQDASGKAQPTVYLDEIGFHTSSTVLLPSDRPLALGITPTPTIAPAFK